MKYNLLKKLIREEIQQLKEQNLNPNNPGLVGMPPSGTNNNTPNVDELNQVLYSALGSPTTPQAIIQGYEELYRKDSRRVKGMPDPRTISGIVSRHFAGGKGGPVTPSALPPLVGAILWRDGWFAAGYIGGALFGGDEVL